MKKYVSPMVDSIEVNLCQQAGSPPQPTPNPPGPPTGPAEVVVRYRPAN